MRWMHPTVRRQALKKGAVSVFSFYCHPVGKGRPVGAQLWERGLVKPTQADAEAAVRVLIEWAGDDPNREGLVDTPGRVGRSYRELFAGYATDPREYLKRTFEEVGGYDELVVLKGIRVVSFCEHHMLPVIGRAHVGYLPTNRVVGISKLARVVHGFARRLQIQEKLTAEIAEAIQDILQPQDAAGHRGGNRGRA